jgi:hypothetical protein
MVDSFFFENCATLSAVFDFSLTILPILKTFPARETRAVLTLNWIIYYEGTTHADKFFTNWYRLNDVIWIKLVSYNNITLFDAL